MSLLVGKNDKGSGVRCSGLCRYIADEAAKCHLREISCRRIGPGASTFIPDLTYSGIERTFLKSALSRWIFSSLPMQQI